jgi:putative ABC transport system permease protein
MIASFAAPLVAQLRALSLAPLRARARRSVLAVLAIAAGVALGLAVNLVNDAALAEMQQAFRSTSGAADVRIEGAARTVDESLYARIGARADVASIAPIIDINAAVEGRRESLRIIGLDPFASAPFTPQFLLKQEDTKHDLFALFAGTHVAVSPAALAWLQEDARSPAGVTLLLPGGRRALEIAGVLAGVEGAQRVAVLDIAVAQELFNLQGQITRLDLRLASGTDRAKALQGIAAQLPPGVHAVTPEMHEQRAANLSRAYRVNLTMLAMIALFSGALLVFSTQMLSVAERAGELAFLRVVGVTVRGTVGLMVFEAVLLGAAGALLGAALGYGLAWSALQVLGGDLGAGYFHDTRPRLAFAPGTTLLFMALGAGAAIVGAWAPALAAARSQPAQALKTGTLHDSTSAGPSPALGAGLFLGGALLALAPAVRGLPLFGYLAIAGLLLGTLMLTPAIAAGLFRRVMRYTAALPGAPVTLRLAVTRIAHAPAQAGISLAAVLAAVSLAGAMAIMVMSFRHSVEDWLEQVLPAPAYLRLTATPLARTQGLDVQAQDALRGTPGVARVEFVRTETLSLDPARPPVTLVIRQFSGTATPDQRLPLVKTFPLPPDAMPRVWVSESFIDLYRQRLGLDPQHGGTFALSLPPNTKHLATLSVRVAGIWRDYSRQHGTVLMLQEDYTRVTGDARAQDAALWLSEGYTADAVLAALKQRLPGQPTLDIALSSDVRAASLKIFDRTFAVTYLLELVAVIIGLAGMAAAFAGLIVARRKEFGMLRHLGLTRGELIRMITLEGAALAALGALLGLLLGLILAAVLVFVINPQSFGWSMDFHVPALQLAGFAVMWVVVAAGAAWFTAQRVLGTQDVVRSVREDW